jgi:hypothetical protein
MRAWLQTRLEPVRYDSPVIVAMHAASGATVGDVVRSRTSAILLGVPLHLAGDWVPHRELRNERFDIGTGLLLIALLAWRRGPTSATTIGALAACAPDLEHRVRLPRPGGKKLFHDGRGWHRSGRFSTEMQLALAALLVARLLLARGERVADGDAVDSGLAAPRTVLRTWLTRPLMFISQLMPSG